MIHRCWAGRASSLLEARKRHLASARLAARRLREHFAASPVVLIVVVSVEADIYDHLPIRYTLLSRQNTADRCEQHRAALEPHWRALSRNLPPPILPD